MRAPLVCIAIVYRFKEGDRMNGWYLVAACGAACAAGGVRPTEKAAPKLSDLIQVKVGAKPITVDVGHSAPFLADLDGDGKAELLVGQFGEGKLRVYRNEG